jgi:hypothetical protein
MNVTYSEKVRQSPETYALLQQATTGLEEAIGPSAGSIRAEWDQTEDEKHQPRYTLRISDPKVSATASLDLEELTRPSFRKFRLLRIWSDLLMARSHKQQDDLQGTNGSED